MRMVRWFGCALLAAASVSFGDESAFKLPHSACRHIAASVASQMAGNPMAQFSRQEHAMWRRRPAHSRLGRTVTLSAAAETPASRSVRTC